MKEAHISIRVDDKEKKRIEKDAKKEGHETTSGFMMWLYRQWKRGES